MKSPEWIKGNEGLIIKGVLAVAGYFFIIHPLLKAVGFIESAEDKEHRKQEEQKAIGAAQAFNPNYYKSKPGAILLTKATAEKYAEIIWDSIDVIDGDDEEDIYGVLKQLKAKTQVSWIADLFYARYGKDMYALLSSNLNSSEMAIVHDIVNGLS
jgi:hypothetical protein